MIELGGGGEAVSRGLSQCTQETDKHCKGGPSVELGIRLRDPQREPSSADCPRVERDCRT